MEEVLDQLKGAAITPKSDKENKSQYEELYKNWGRLGNQEERRQEILEIQKYNRNNKIDSYRGILELVNAVEQEEIFRMQRRVYYKPTIYVAGFNKASASYNNVLMMSEWMIEKPEDFCDKWYVVPCPKGVRMLVVANEGSTKCYTKYGQFRYKNRTALPGGNLSDKSQRKCCVLDCFYVEKINTMFVLDLLAWNSQPMTDGETEFRDYWLKTQLAENPDLQKISKSNEIIFKLLPKVSCEPESFNEFMMKSPHFEDNCPELDGLLFYHKTAHYFAGETPLVGWLFPYMVPEVIGSDTKINPCYAALPPDYVNQADFIQKFEAKYSKKNFNRSRTSSNSMDTTDVESTKSTEKSEKTEKSNSKTTEVMDAEEIKPENNGENKTEQEHDNYPTIDQIEEIVQNQEDQNIADVEIKEIDKNKEDKNIADSEIKDIDQNKEVQNIADIEISEDK